MNSRIDDLRGIVQLAGDGIAGVTDIAQALHGAIGAGGIAGFVYGTVRKTSSLVTRGLGMALAGTAALRGPTAAPATEDPRRRTILSALNGVVGDHLERTGNPLAVGMVGRHADESRDLRLPADRTCIVPRTGHMDLLSSEAVAQELRRWFAYP